MGSTTTLRSWGNGQGVLIPKSVCDQAGLKVGDEFDISLSGRVLTLEPTRRGRTQVLTAKDVLGNWTGSYVVPPDLAGSGREADWGSPVGTEAW